MYIMYLPLHRYRKLALQYHPEKSLEPRAKEKFKELAEAYDVLSHRKRTSLCHHSCMTALASGNLGTSL